MHEVTLTTCETSDQKSVFFEILFWFRDEILSVQGLGLELRSLGFRDGISRRWVRGTRFKV